MIRVCFVFRVQCAKVKIKGEASIVEDKLRKVPS